MNGEHKPIHLKFEPGIAVRAFLGWLLLISLAQYRNTNFLLEGAKQKVSVTK